jgi:hypothetical protein
VARLLAVFQIDVDGKCPRSPGPEAQILQEDSAAQEVYAFGPPADAVAAAEFASEAAVAGGTVVF